MPLGGGVYQQKTGEYLDLMHILSHFSALTILKSNFWLIRWCIFGDNVGKWCGSYLVRIAL